MGIFDDFDSFDDFFDDDIFEEWRNVSNNSTNFSSYEKPTYDIVKSDGKIIVLIELPGVKKEDIDLELVENRLLNLKADFRKENDPYYKFQKSRNMEGYACTIRLPEEIKSVDNTKFNNGVLEVELTPKTKSTRVSIN